MSQYGIVSPALAAVVMLAALPLGRLFALLERYHRQYENHAFDRLLLWAKRPEDMPGPGVLTRRSIMVMLPLNFVAFTMALAGLIALMHLILPRLAPLLGTVPLKWPHLWVVGSIGAVLSLRHRPAYAILLSGVVLAIASRMLL